VTTKEIANRFANGMEFFSTFGGIRWLRGRIGVLDVVRDEALQDRALQVGKYWMTDCRNCRSVTGSSRCARPGLFLVSIWCATAKSASSHGSSGLRGHRLRECGILAGTDGHTTTSSSCGRR